MSRNRTGLINRAALLVATAWMVAGCAGGASTKTVYKLTDSEASPLQSVLVIGVAGDLNGRAAFERKLARDLEQGGVKAIAYHTMGRDAELSREAIESAVTSLDVDGVVVTRETGRNASIELQPGDTSVKETAKGGGLVNLFRYDYETLNEPSSLKLDIDVSLATDLYSIMGEQRVWTGESSFSGEENIQILIDTAAADIAAKLLDTGLLGR